MGLHEQETNHSNHAPKKKWKHFYMCNGDETDKITAKEESENRPLPINGITKRSPNPTDHVERPQYLTHSLESTTPQYLSVAPRRTPSVSPPIRNYPSRSSPDKHQRLSSSQITSHFISNSLPALKGALVVHPKVPHDICSSSSSSDGSLASSYQPPNVLDGGVRIVPLDSPGSSNEGAHLNGMLRANGMTTSSHSDREELLEYKDDGMRKRAGSTPSREVHNKLEKNRRAHLKECFEALRKQLPAMDDKKISNQTILKAAHRCIQGLKRKEREYDHEMERLARQKIAYQQQLASLKKELQSKWDHIDFSRILPDNSHDQFNEKDTKSTSSAPENPDYEERARGRIQLTPATQDGYFFAKIPPRQDSPPPRVQESFDDNQPLDLCTSGPPIKPIRAPISPEWTAKRVHPYADENAMNLSPGYSKRGVVSSSPTSPVKLSTNRVSPSYELARVSPSTSSNVSIVKTGKVITSLPQTEMAQSVIPVVPLTNATRMSNLQSGTTISRIPHTSSSSGTTKHTVVAGNGIQLPVMTSGVQLSNATGSLVNPSAIQVITPEGYKLLSATEIPANGTKPVAITLAQPEALEQLAVEDGKPRSFVVSLNKSGVSTLHLTVPTAQTRAISSSASSNGVPATTVPLNLTVSGSTTVEMSQAGSTSLIPSYIPLTNQNGLARLMPGMSVVGPLVVSPPQRSVVVPTAVAATKGLKPHSVGTTNVSLVPTQYANSFSGNLVNSVVVMSHPSAPRPQNPSSAKP